MNASCAPYELNAASNMAALSHSKCVNNLQVLASQPAHARAASTQLWQAIAENCDVSKHLTATHMQRYTHLPALYRGQLRHGDSQASRLAAL